MFCRSLVEDEEENSLVRGIEHWYSLLFAPRDNFCAGRRHAQSPAGFDTLTSGALIVVFPANSIDLYRER